jgi:hypothetical protein
MALVAALGPERQRRRGAGFEKRLLRSVERVLDRALDIERAADDAVERHRHDDLSARVAEGLQVPRIAGDVIDDDRLAGGGGGRSARGLARSAGGRAARHHSTR